MRRVKLVARGLVLLALFVAVAYSAVNAALASAEHAALRQEVADLESRHAAQKSDYSASLADSRRLRTDPDAQVDLLKEKMGYARKNEIPIVVTIEAPTE